MKTLQEAKTVLANTTLKQCRGNLSIYGGFCPVAVLFIELFGGQIEEEGLECRLDGQEIEDPYTFINKNLPKINKRSIAPFLVRQNDMQDKTFKEIAESIPV